MRRTPVFAFAAAFVLAAAFLMAAAALRANDAPYIAYAEGDRRGALPALESRAQSGDGFAAFLVGNGYRDGTFGEPDPRTAAAWYMAAARAGEIRAVSPYLEIALDGSPTEGACRAAVPLLELAGRAGDAGALIMLGNYRRDGRCGKPDPADAAGHYLAAKKIDRRYGQLYDRLVSRLGRAAVGTQHPIPESFDLAAEDALARFVEDAPALLGNAIR